MRVMGILWGGRLGRLLGVRTRTRTRIGVGVVDGVCAPFSKGEILVRGTGLNGRWWWRGSGVFRRRQGACFGG
jgi:hypothetical protein